MSRSSNQPNLSPLKTRFIINPHSGHVRRNLPEVLRFTRHRGHAFVYTEHPGHATALARAALADGCTRVVAVGGDGTMNEVARALVHSGATLALIPCGSGDGLGRHLGIHGPVSHSLSLLETGRPRIIDTATADEHPFFNVAGLGLEADLAQRFHTARVRGLTGYLIHGLSTLRDTRAELLRIEHDGQATEFRAGTLAIANGDQYGNDARIAPGARCDDGALDLTGLPPLNAGNLPLLGWRLFRGQLERSRQVLRLRASSFVVKRERAGWIHTDGETHPGSTTVHFRVVPSSLRILCPAG